jgi:exosortase
MANNIAASTTDPQMINPPKQMWRELGLHSYIRIAIIGGLIYSLFNKEIGGIVNQWISDPGWSHGFLIPFFSLYFLSQAKQEILNNTYKPNYFGLLLLIGVILFYIFNTISPAGYGYFRQLSAVGAMWSVAFFLGGRPLIKYTWLPIIYLIFAIPLPDEILRSATIPMRLWAAGASTMVLNLFPNLHATANGVIIEIVYKGKTLNPPLDVAEACSGMRLLMTFFALGVAMAYLHYRPAWQRLVLLASTVPIAILCNVVRVTTTGFIYVLGNPQYAQGFYHDALGMAMLPLAFVLYGTIAWFMSNLFVEIDESNASNVIIRNKNAK